MMLVASTGAVALVVPVMRVVASGKVLVMLFHSMLPGLTKSVPVTIKVKLGLPAVLVVGDIVNSVAGLLSTSNVSAGEAVPPPGPAVLTVTVGKPALASR